MGNHHNEAWNFCGCSKSLWTYPTFSHAMSNTAFVMHTGRHGQELAKTIYIMADFFRMSSSVKGAHDRINMMYQVEILVQLFGPEI